MVEDEERAGLVVDNPALQLAGRVGVDSGRFGNGGTPPECPAALRLDQPDRGIAEPHTRQDQQVAGTGAADACEPCGALFCGCRQLPEAAQLVRHITSGGTEATVTHGLGITPSDVQITALGAVTAPYVDTVGATTFKIHSGGAVGADTPVAWEARYVVR